MKIINACVWTYRSPVCCILSILFEEYRIHIIFIRRKQEGKYMTLNFIESVEESLEKKNNLVLVFCNFLKYDHCRLLIGRQGVTWYWNYSKNPAIRCVFQFFIPNPFDIRNDRYVEAAAVHGTISSWQPTEDAQEAAICVGSASVLLPVELPCINVFTFTNLSAPLIQAIQKFV